MVRPLEPNDNILATLISVACQRAGLVVTKTENNYHNVGVTPYVALARAMRDIRKEKPE